MKTNHCLHNDMAKDNHRRRSPLPQIKGMLSVKIFRLWKKLRIKKSTQLWKSDYVIIFIIDIPILLANFGVVFEIAGRKTGVIPLLLFSFLPSKEWNSLKLVHMTKPNFYHALNRILLHFLGPQAPLGPRGFTTNMWHSEHAWPIASVGKSAAFWRGLMSCDCVNNGANHITSATARTSMVAALVQQRRDQVWSTTPLFFIYFCC